MKTLAIACALTLAGLSASASTFDNSVSMENEASTSAPLPASKSYNGYSAKGFRFAFVKPFVSIKADSKDAAPTTSREKENISQSYGGSVGYAYLPINSIGFTTNIAVMNIANQTQNFVLYRVDGNVAYALTPTLNFKGGLNISASSKEEMGAEYNPKVGVQGSVGLQITKNLGIDAGAVMMNQTMTNSTKVSEVGPEVSLSGTF